MPTYQAIQFGEAIPVAQPKEEYVILPPGEYWYRVDEREFGTWSSGKLAGMPVCKIDLTLWNADGRKGTAKANLTNCTDFAWKIRQFWTSAGENVPENEAYLPPWNEIVGRIGRCKVENRQFQGRNGETLVSNDVKEFLPPDGQAAPAVPGEEGANYGEGDDIPF